MIKPKKAVSYTETVDNATPETILPANANRKYAGIYNPTNTGMWIGFGEAAVIGTGTYIPAGGGYEIDESNLWTGSVSILAATGTGHVVAATDFS